MPLEEDFAKYYRSTAYKACEKRIREAIDLLEETESFATTHTFAEMQKNVQQALVFLYDCV